jgi:hypothetical protein
VVLVIWVGPRACNAVASWVSDRIASLAFVRSTATATLQTALGELRAKRGLVVGYRPVNTIVTLERTTSLPWIGWPIGSVTVRLEVDDSRVLYVIPADPAWAIDALDEHTFILTLPPPAVDTDVVEVQSDPAKFKVFINNDWAEHLIPSGKDVDDAKRMVRGAVIEQASAKPALAEVRVQARQVAESFMRDLLEQAGISSPRVIARFSDESPRD